MGTDVFFHLLYGFKIDLNTAFDLGLIRREIMENDDDWQLISDKESCDEIIDRQVLSTELRSFLESGEWNLYILASTQYEYDINSSYLFIYNEEIELYSGRVPDYKTGVFITEHKQHPDIILNDTNFSYGAHWIVKGSW